MKNLYFSEFRGRRMAAMLCAVLVSMGASAQYETAAPVKTTPKETAAPMRASANTTAKVSYQNPVPLAYLGTISQDDNAVCNLLFRHKDVNGGAWLLASSDKAVSYKGTTTGIATAWQWSIPGATPSTSTAQTVSANYSAPGIYDMPTLSVTTADGPLTYKPDLTIKVGGESEITTIDCRDWGSTYMLSAFPYAEGGYMGGTNALDIVGWGNLFMLGTDDAYLNGINLYLLSKPTKYAEDARLKVQVWMTNITDGSVSLAYTPVEGGYISMKDIKADGEDGAWSPIYGGAVATLTLDEPLSLYGKTIFFVSVEGFSNDPATEDFCLLTDVMGKQMDEVTASNLLSHNSFARQKGETDYLRPINSYGGGTGSFAICPIISIPADPAGINAPSANKNGGFSAHFVDDAVIEVTSADEGSVSVCDASGRTIARGSVVGGNGKITLSSAPCGLYIVSGPGGKSMKILKGVRG